jgi:hypothetical protein
MNSKQTVLVLGAGASIPYGFPSGETLKQDIIETLDINKPTEETNKWYDIIRRTFKYSNNEIEEFRINLQESYQPTIDAFLERQRRFLPIGKAAIALSLIPRENDVSFSDNNNQEQKWYHKLFQKLDSNIGRFNECNISIITFNYDRSLEHFIFQRIMYSYGCAEEECKKKMQNIPIIHVYGQLGYL